MGAARRYSLDVPGGRHALVVAADEFDDVGLRALVSPRRDAADLARALADPDIGGFEVKTIVNRPRHEVERAIARFFSAGQRDETLLLYFSGHGLKDENGMLYFAMADTEVDLLSASAVSSSFVSGQLGRARAQTKIVLLDCCYSGAFSRSLTTKDDRLVNAAEELRGIGRVIITASNALQYSFEGSTPSGDARQSVFTKHLVAGLETGAADLDGDGRIAVDELYRYVHDQVVQENPQQRPSISIETQGMVVVASSRAGIRPAVLPAELLSALANALPRVRLGAIQDLVDLLHGTDPRITAAARLVLHELLDDDSRRVAEAAGAALAAEAMSGTPDSLPDQPLAIVPGEATVPPSDIPTAGGRPVPTARSAGTSLDTSSVAGTDLPGGTQPGPAPPHPASQLSPPNPSTTNVGLGWGRRVRRVMPRSPLWIRPVGMAMVGLAGVLLIITLTTTPWQRVDCPSTAQGPAIDTVVLIAQQYRAVEITTIPSPNRTSTSVRGRSVEDLFRSLSTTTASTRAPTSVPPMSPIARSASSYDDYPALRTDDCGSSPSAYAAVAMAGVAALLAGTSLARRSTMSPSQLGRAALAMVASTAFAYIAVVVRRADYGSYERELPGRDRALGFAVVALVGALLALLRGGDDDSRSGSGPARRPADS